jgi:hypothetical protein
MAKDRRLYARFSLDFADHPKIAPLSDAAFRCLVEATLWSRQHLTDGFLARRYAVARWSLETLHELCTNDTEKPSLSESEEGFYIRDFDEHQDTRADLEARRQHAVSAGRRGGLAKAKHSAKRRAKHTAKQTSSKVLSKTVAETETLASEAPTRASDAAASRAAPPKAPRGTPPPLAKTTNGRYAEPQPTPQSLEAKRIEQQNRREETAARFAEIANCSLCDDEGYRENGTICDHVDRTLTVRRGREEINKAMGWTR